MVWSNFCTKNNNKTYQSQIYSCFCFSKQSKNKRWNNSDERPHCRGRIFHGDNVTQHWPVCSIAVSCSSGDVMPLLIFHSVQCNSDSQCFSMSPTPKIVGKSRTPSNTWFLGTTWVTIKTPYQSVQLFLQGSRLSPIDRQTDRPCYSVCSNRPHLATAAMQPNNTIFSWYLH